MFHELSANELVQALSEAGQYPHPDLLREIDGRRTEAEPLLLAMFADAYDDQWVSDEDPRWYRFGHAGKFMLHWQNQAALPLFARLYKDDAKWEEFEIFEDDLVHYGPAAIPC